MISVVQSKGTTGTSLTLTSPVTAGNTLVLVAGIYVSSGTVAGPDPTLGGLTDNWTFGNNMSRTFSGAEVRVSGYYDPDCAGGSSAVAISNWAGGSGTAGFYVWEVNGLGSAPILDVIDSYGLGHSVSTWESGGSGGVTTNYPDEFWAGMTAFITSNAGNTGPASPWADVTEGNVIGYYQITTSTGTAYATGSTYLDFGNSQSVSMLFTLAPDTGGGPTTITDTDNFNTTTDTITAQKMAATDASAATADTPIAVRLSVADTSNPAVDASSLTAHPSDTDAFQLTLDVPGSQAMAATDQSQAAVVETALPGPQAADASNAAVDTSVSASATVIDTDLFNSTLDIGPVPASIITATDQAVAVEAADIMTNLVQDTDAFNPAVDASALGLLSTIIDTDAVSSFDIGQRFPFTDTDAGSFTDTVVAFGTILSDTDTANPTTETSSANPVHLDTDASAPAAEALTLIIQNSDSVFSDDEPGTLLSGRLSDTDAATGADTGFVDFTGLEHITVTLSTSWRTLQRSSQAATVGWRTRQLLTQQASLGWNVIQRPQQTAYIAYHTLAARNPETPPVLGWRTLVTAEKTATIRWGVRVSDSHMAQLAWNVHWRCLLGPLATLSWNVLPETPTRVTKPAVIIGWRTIQRTSVTAELGWVTNGIPAHVNGHPALVRWNTRASTSVSKSIGWDVLPMGAPQMVTTSCSLGWHLLQGNSKTAIVSWYTLAGVPVSQATALGWNTIERISVSCRLQWNARYRASTYESTVWWNTLKGTTTPAAALGWNAWQRKNKTGTTDWNVIRHVPGAVTLLGWNMRARPAARAIITWNTAGHTSVSTAVRWDTHQRTSTASTVIIGWRTHRQVGAPAALGWDVLALLPVSVAAPLIEWNTTVQVSPVPVRLGWNVTRRYSKPAVGLSWNVRQSTAETATVGWNVRGRESQAVLLEWNVMPRVAATALISWGVIQHIGVTFPVEWLTLENVTITVTLEWNMATKVQGLIMNAPAVPWQSSYPSR